MKAGIWIGRSLGSLVVLAMVVGSSTAQPRSPEAKSANVHFDDQLKPAIAVVVNGEPISLAEVESATKQRLLMARQATDAQRRQMQMEVMDRLIDERLLQQYLRTHGPRVDEAEVQRRMTQLETDLKARGRSLKDVCRDQGWGEEQIRQTVTGMIQWAGYVNGQFTDAQLRRYYEDNRDFFEQVSVRASQIVFRISISASETERQAARSRLQALRREIVAGKLDFAEAARKYSQCSSAKAGGDIGYFPRKFAVEEALAKAAFALKAGEVSDVIQTEYGLVLLKVTDRKAGIPSSFDKIKDEVREIAAEEMCQKLLTRQRETSKIEVFIGEPALKTPGK